MGTKMLVILLLMAAVLLSSGCTEGEMTAEEIAEKVQQEQFALDDYSATVLMTSTSGENSQIVKYELVEKGPDRSKITMLLPQEEAGIIRVENGDQMWRYDPEDEAFVLYDGLLLPDDYNGKYSEMIEYYLNEADIGIMGMEIYEGRETYVLLSEPKKDRNDDGGPVDFESKIWVDKETWVPLRLETTFTEGGGSELTGVVEYQDFKVNTGIEDEDFEIPEDTEVIMSGSLPIQPELTLEEAKNISANKILIPSYLPEGYEFVKVFVDTEAYKAAGEEGTFIGIIYSKEEESSIYISEEFNEGGNAVVVPSIEADEEFEVVTINGEEGKLLTFGNGDYRLDWEVNGNRVIISTYHGDRDELIKIAESMK
ncbi:DUF4367 domain-containing protein [Methanolobus sp. WCC4]|uniref:DUF4367 domain-containing protein n=1 Tax=Methanolobus sp. WCC4 TaxID=3125784 RepID=UPI0030FA5FCF